MKYYYCTLFDVVDVKLGQNWAIYLFV